MNTSFREAEVLLQECRDELDCYLGDNDPIECYNPETLDTAIHKLVEARSKVAIGRILDDWIADSIS